MPGPSYPSFDLFSVRLPSNITKFQQQYVRDLDWESSRLGSVRNWPPQLRQMVNIVQKDNNPSCIYWDVPKTTETPDVAIVYNEAYTHLMFATPTLSNASVNVSCSGQKHPDLQGTDPKFGFAEIWDRFAAILENARRDGNIVEDKDAFLLLERHGFLEETYFSWKFIPIIGPEGYIVGSYATVFEVTQEVIRARRLSTIQHLGQIITSSLPNQGHWKHILAGLEGNPNDVPLALVYSVLDRTVGSAADELVINDSSKYCYLEGTLGVPRDHAISPQIVDLSGDIINGWATAFRNSLRSNNSYLVLNAGDESLPSTALEGITWRGFGIPSTQFVICPIEAPTTSTLVSFLVIALNPRRQYDKDYKGWIELIIKSIAIPHVEAAFAVADSAKLSERLLTQARYLQESEKKFMTFAKRSTNGIMITTPEGKLLFGNTAWFDLIQVNPSMREDYNDAIHPDDRELRESKWQEIVRDKLPVNYLIRFNKPWKPPRILGAEAAETCTYALVSGWPDLDSDGNVQTVMATVTDISEIKFIEEQLRQKTVDAELRVKQQEAFVDMVSHEIRNPLSAILHCAEQISSSLNKQLMQSVVSMVTDDAHSIIQAADTIAYCAMHQKRIVDDILTLSKLDSNLLDVSPQLVEPIDLVETALKMFDAELKKLNMHLQLVVDSSMQKFRVHWLLFDSNRLLQVLVNLMTNAIKFTRDSPSRDITVTISASLEPPPDADGDLTYVPSKDKKFTPNQAWQDWPPDETVFLSCSVSDTGKGITAEELKGLFHRFSQASPKTQVQYGGSGLGLYISRQLSEMQGGKIGVKSKYGLGSTFTFYIKTCRASPSEISDLKMQNLDFDRIKEELPNACGSKNGLFEINESETNLPSTLAQVEPVIVHANSQDRNIDELHILVVEDNIVNQKVLAKQLLNHGCRVSVANHGVECLSFLENTTFWASPTSLNNNSGRKQDVISIILMDWEMPIMDGLTCVRKIRELERSGEIKRHVPVIAVTANARGQQIQIAEEAGMDDIVTKPYRISEILSQVVAVLKRLEGAN